MEKVTATWKFLSNEL